MKNELIVPEVGEVKVPTTKLNTTQQKQYKEWGYETLEKIEGMAIAIEEKKKDEYNAINEKKVIDKIEQSNKPLLQQLNQLNLLTKEMVAVSEKGQKELLEIDEEILFDEAQLKPLFESILKLRKQVAAEYNKL